MWQRIQTLYLFLSTALIGVMFFCIKAVDAAADVELTFVRYTPYLILMIIISLLNLLALTCYKHRIFQMRTAVLAAIITLAFQAWLAVDYFTADKTLVFRVPAIFPLVCVVLDFLAARSILADEMLVRSASRLRASRKDRKNAKKGPDPLVLRVKNK